jgi:hypothetical protein
MVKGNGDSPSPGGVGSRASRAFEVYPVVDRLAGPTLWDPLRGWAEFPLTANWGGMIRITAVPAARRGINIMSPSFPSSP